MPMQTETLVFHERLTAEMNVLVHQEAADGLRRCDAGIRIGGAVVTGLMGLAAVKSVFETDATLIVIACLSLVALVIGAVSQALRFSEKAAKHDVLVERWNELAADLRELDEAGSENATDAHRRYEKLRRQTDDLHASDLGPLAPKVAAAAQLRIRARHAARFGQAA